MYLCCFYFFLRMSHKFVFVYVRVLSEYIYTAAIAGSICESFRRRGGASLPAPRPSHIQGDYIPTSWSFGHGLLKLVYSFFIDLLNFFFLRNTALDHRRSCKLAQSRSNIKTNPSFQEGRSIRLWTCARRQENISVF